jgi:formamidopyrimidine-DNA glycosylase
VPERPDLEYVVPILSSELVGKIILEVRIKKPVVIRVAARGTFEARVTGTTIVAVYRRAHFVVLELAYEHERERDLDVVVAPMLAGRFALAERGAKTPADLAVSFLLSDGRELRYRDDVQMGKVYAIEHADFEKVPGLSSVGIDVLNPAVFTREALGRLARARRDQVKVFLMDKSALDAMGNAYADEVLFEARIHPKAMARSLSEAELDRLHAAIVSVLDRARATIAARRPALDEKLRDFLSVRGRKGELCPRCGAKLRAAGVHGHDAIFCPECQVDRRGTGIVDWRKK